MHPLPPGFSTITQSAFRLYVLRRAIRRFALEQPTLSDPFSYTLWAIRVEVERYSSAGQGWKSYQCARLHYEVKTARMVRTVLGALKAEVGELQPGSSNTPVKGTLVRTAYWEQHRRARIYSSISIPGRVGDMPAQCKVFPHLRPAQNGV